MKIAFSLIVKDDGSAQNWLEMIAAAGFAGLEPTFVLEGTLPTAADPRRSAERLTDMANRAGLAIPSMRGGPGFWGTFASADAEKRKRAVTLAADAMEAVKIMGGDTLLIVPGQWEEGVSYGQTWKNAIETANRVAEVSERIGIKVGLENVENRFLLSPREWMQFLDEVGSDRVRMYFDVGNVVYMKLGRPEQWMVELGKEYITRIHFKDSGMGGPLTYLLEGAVNWPAVGDAIRKIGYDDWVGIELTPPMHCVEVWLEGTRKAAEQIVRK